jgi:ubiquinone/menaquinone biosynthesis C-methylase UbiE
MALSTAARVGLMTGFREAMMWKSRKEDTQRLTEWANHRAQETSRTLVVLEKGDKIQTGSIPLPDDSGVILVLYALEYVPSMDQAMGEIFRVAGSASNLFVAHMNKQSFLAWLHPGARYVIASAPPATPNVQARRTGTEYPVLDCRPNTKPFCIAGLKPYGA